MRNLIGSEDSGVYILFMVPIHFVYWVLGYLTTGFQLQRFIALN